MKYYVLQSYDWKSIKYHLQVFNVVLNHCGGKFYVYNRIEMWWFVIHAMLKKEL